MVRRQYRPPPLQLNRIVPVLQLLSVLERNHRRHRRGHRRRHHQQSKHLQKLPQQVLSSHQILQW